jgi:hypothetical protein
MEEMFAERHVKVDHSTADGGISERRCVQRRVRLQKQSSLANVRNVLNSSSIESIAENGGLLLDEF